MIHRRQRANIIILNTMQNTSKCTYVNTVSVPLRVSRKYTISEPSITFVILIPRLIIGAIDFELWIFSFLVTHEDFGALMRNHDIRNPHATVLFTVFIAPITCILFFVFRNYFTWPSENAVIL